MWSIINLKKNPARQMLKDGRTRLSTTNPTVPRRNQKEQTDCPTMEQMLPQVPPHNHPIRQKLNPLHRGYRL